MDRCVERWLAHVDVDVEGGVHEGMNAMCSGKMGLKSSIGTDIDVEEEDTVKGSACGRAGSRHPGSGCRCGGSRRHRRDSACFDDDLILLDDKSGHPKR